MAATLQGKGIVSLLVDIESYCLFCFRFRVQINPSIVALGALSH